MDLNKRGSVQKLRVLVTSTNCPTAKKIQLLCIKRKLNGEMLSHLWVYLIITLIVTRVLARFTNSCHGFCLLKTSCGLVLLASLASAARLLWKMFLSLITQENNCLPKASVCNFSSCVSSVEVPCRGAIFHNHLNLNLQTVFSRVFTVPLKFLMHLFATLQMATFQSPENNLA